MVTRQQLYRCARTPLPCRNKVELNIFSRDIHFPEEVDQILGASLIPPEREKKILRTKKRKKGKITLDIPSLETYTFDVTWLIIISSQLSLLVLEKTPARKLQKKPKHEAICEP
jgi:hypothetical protein